jgi:hypothetical protein
MSHLEALSTLRSDLASRISNRPQDHASRRASLKEFLTTLNHAWWSSHEANREAYEKELTALNHAAGWTGDHSQKSNIETNLLPPKFFSAPLDTLDDSYVLCVSLNHKFRGLTGHFVDEVADFQHEASHLQHCLQYFDKEYAYKTFFLARAKVLKAYANLTDDPPSQWRSINRHFGAYVEAFPTWSEESTVPHDAFDDAPFFVTSLNRLAHAAFLGILPPRVVLAAGRDAVAALSRVMSEHNFSSSGAKDVTYDVLDRTRRARGPITVQTFKRETQSIRVISSPFLRTAAGPNSDDELARLGRLLSDDLSKW